MEKFPGYKNRTSLLLKKANAEIGDKIQVLKGKETFEGLLIPRSEFDDHKHIVIKLSNGYNLGILVDQETVLKRIGKGEKPAFSTPPMPEQNLTLPKVVIVSTGGTIASRVDYRTGGVRPALTASDLYSIVPELSSIASIKAQILSSKFSENITPHDWSQLAKHIANQIESKATGVIVAHGTDTMGYTAAALSFALQNLPVPVILVGSQRSADRPSSDAAVNLIGAVKAAANAPFAEVAIAMHGTVSDDSMVFHRGVRVRKCHTSRRDAFQSINSEPLARFEGNRIRMTERNYRERDTTRKLLLKPRFDDRVALIKFYPGADEKIISWYVDNSFKGIVLEGTGLGHVSSKYIPALERAIEDKVLVGMTSQCIWGRVNLNVYDTGRELSKIGVMPLGDMFPETALVKMMWVLGQTKDPEKAKNFLTQNVTKEFSDRTKFQESNR